jgi:SP family myo-inositol transporter-like MFS transporter 13
MILMEMAPRQLHDFGQLNTQMWLVVFNGAIGGLCYGYAFTSMGAALLQIKRPNVALDACPGITDHPLSTVEQEMLTAFITLGAFFGCCVASLLNHNIGRRKVCLCTSLILGLGSICSFLASDLPMMLAARIVLGVGVGMLSHTVPLFISECAPTNLRGAVCFINALMISGGQVGAAVVGLICFYLEMPYGWRWMLGALFPLSVVMFIGFYLQPESPRWLLSHGLEEQAREAFAILRGLDEKAKEKFALIRHPPGGSTAHSLMTSFEMHKNEFDDMVCSINAERPDSGTDDMFSINWQDASIRRPLLLGCFLMFMNQCVGNNLFLLYGPSVLRRALGQDIATEIGTCFTDANKFVVACNILFPLLQMVGIFAAWFCVESVGRRPLILMSTLCVAICLAATGYAFSMEVVNASSVVFCISMYLVAFGIGLAPVPWAVNTEIYPLHARAQCLSLALAAKWLFGFVTSQTYLSLSLKLSTSKVDALNHPDGIFWFYCVIAFAALPILNHYMVETKGLTLEQIKELFRDSKHSDSLQCSEKRSDGFVSSWQKPTSSSSQ